MRNAMFSAYRVVATKCRLSKYQGPRRLRLVLNIHPSAAHAACGLSRIPLPSSPHRTGFHTITANAAQKKKEPNTNAPTVGTASAALEISLGGPDNGRRTGTKIASVRPLPHCLCRYILPYAPHGHETGIRSQKTAHAWALSVA